jgi:2-dehydro-3-deoxygluconokinase
MMNPQGSFNILADDLSRLNQPGPVFVTFGETMLRDTPADMQRAERTRRLDVSLSGSEHILAVGLARLGISCRYITRAPDNPYGRMLQNVTREQWVDADYMVWAPKTELMGRYIFELGRTPRRTMAWYQRRHSAASLLDAGMVDWQSALAAAKLFHVSGITPGLAMHSGYERNYNLAAMEEALAARPDGCLVGMDINYRSTLWPPEVCSQVLTPIITGHVDYLITTIEDMARLYGMDCGGTGAEAIQKGDLGQLRDSDLKDFASRVMERFRTKVVGITIRYPDSFERHRWESAALDDKGNFVRSAEVRPIVLWDRIGGGDTWNAGFYYGLLSTEESGQGIAKGVVVGDAISRLQQTLMFDLGIVTKEEVQALMDADLFGGGKRESR